jgi:hypothetical protein
MLSAMTGGTTKDDGSFLVENIAPGKYRLMVMHIPKKTYVKSIRIGGQNVLDSGFETTAGVDLNAVVDLGVDAGEISGVVEGNNGHVVRSAMVTLLPNPARGERSDLYRVTSTDQNGQFDIDDIAPGDYKLYAWEDVEPDSYMDSEFIKAHEAHAYKVSVKPKSRQQVKLSQVPKEDTDVQ